MQFPIMRLETNYFIIYSVNWSGRVKLIYSLIDIFFRTTNFQQNQVVYKWIDGRFHTIWETTKKQTKPYDIPA